MYKYGKNLVSGFLGIANHSSSQPPSLLSEFIGFFEPRFSLSLIRIFFWNVAILHLAILLGFQKLTNKAFANTFGVFERYGFLLKLFSEWPILQIAIKILRILICKASTGPQRRGNGFSSIFKNTPSTTSSTTITVTGLRGRKISNNKQSKREHSNKWDPHGEF